MDLLSGDSGHSEVESKLDKHKSRVQLFEILSDSTPFSLEELKRLVRYELGIEPETFTSNNANKLTFADNLIGYCRRNGHLSMLLSAMRQAKPNEPRIEALALEVGLPDEPISAAKRATTLAGGGGGPIAPPPSGPGKADDEDGSGSVWGSPTVIAAIIGLIGTVLTLIFTSGILNRDTDPEQPPTQIAVATAETPIPGAPYPEPATETPTFTPSPTDTLIPPPPTNTPTFTPSPTDTPTDTPLPPTDTPTFTSTPPDTPIPVPPTVTPTSTPTVNPIVTHRVQPGEYLSCISQNYYGTNTVGVILCGFNQERGVIGDGADNPAIDPCSRIRSGQILHIPYPPTRVVPQITLPPHEPNACPAVPTETITATTSPTQPPSSTPTPTSSPLPPPSETPTPLPTPTPTPAETETLTATPTPTEAEEENNEESEETDGETTTDSSTFHIVQPEDNLSCIANFYYGAEELFEGLCEANEGLIDQCPNIQIGMTLVIPDNLLGVALLPVESRVDRCEADGA